MFGAGEQAGDLDAASELVQARDGLPPHRHRPDAQRRLEPQLATVTPDVRKPRQGDPAGGDRREAEPGRHRTQFGDALGARARRERDHSGVGVGVQRAVELDGAPGRGRGGRLQLDEAAGAPCEERWAQRHRQVAARPDLE